VRGWSKLKRKKDGGEKIENGDGLETEAVKIRKYMNNQIILAGGVGELKEKKNTTATFA